MFMPSWGREITTTGSFGNASVLAAAKLTATDLYQVPFPGVCRYTYSVGGPVSACSALLGTTALNPELTNGEPIASPKSGRGWPTVPPVSLVLLLLSLAPFHTSTPSMPAQPA